MDPTPPAKPIIDPSKMLLAPKVEDAALLLAHMGRWRWAIGTKEVAFTREICELLDFDPQFFTPTLSSLRGLVSARDMSRLFITVNRLIQDGRDGVADFTLKHPSRENIEFYVRCYLCCERDADGATRGQRPVSASPATVDLMKLHYPRAIAKPVAQRLWDALGEERR